jgi:hypothetical protein
MDVGGRSLQQRTQLRERGMRRSLIHSEAIADDADIVDCVRQVRRRGLVRRCLTNKMDSQVASCYERPPMPHLRERGERGSVRCHDVSAVLVSLTGCILPSAWIDIKPSSPVTYHPAHGRAPFRSTPL